MLTLKIISTGDFKEKYLRDCAEEYKKRIGGWAKFEEIVLKEERLSDNPSQNEIKTALENEEKHIVEKIGQKAYVVAMCIEGKELSSTELAQKINEITVSGYSEIVFVIGSSYGLSEGIKQRANMRLSVSKLTFPHQLFKIMLMETLYRSLSIINGTKYHK